MTEETSFSKILQGAIPCDEVYSDELCMAFRDIEPQAPVHILIIPKKPLESLKETEAKDKDLLGHLLYVSAQIAKNEGLENWRTVINTGIEAGQILRIRGKGFPRLRRSGRGDQLVKIQIDVPKKLSKDEKAILQEYQNAKRDNDVNFEKFDD